VRFQAAAVMFKIIRNFLNGLAFGITETIPGVSGGTIAIILGFYFELIETINHFTEDLRKHLKYLLPLMLGMASGIILFSSIINFLLLYFSFPTMLLFIGLIAGIIPHIYFKAKEKGQGFKIAEIFLIVIPFFVLLTVSFLKGVPVTDPAEAINNISIPFMIFIFFSGIIAAAALVIPGISGSFVLLLLGIYPLAIHSVSSIRLLLADITNITLMMNICKVLAPLAMGVVIGGLCMVRLIEKLLKNHSKTVYSIILGLLLGSVCVLFKEPMVYKSGISMIIIIIGIATFSLGSVVSFMLGKKRL
jgi:putative membrane protein